MVGKSRETTTYSKASIASFGLLIVSVIAYLYFLNLSVVEVVMRTELIQDQRDLNAEIASLEAKYIKAQHAIATRIASIDEYERESAKIFVSREQAKLVLNTN